MEKKKAWKSATSEVQKAAIKIVQREEHARYEEDKVKALKAYQLALDSELEERGSLALPKTATPIPGDCNALESPHCDLDDSCNAAIAASNMERESSEKEESSEVDETQQSGNEEGDSNAEEAQESSEQSGNEEGDSNAEETQESSDDSDEELDLAPGREEASESDGSEGEDPVANPPERIAEHLEFLKDWLPRLNGSWEHRFAEIEKSARSRWQ